MFAPKCFLTQQCLHLSAFSHNNDCTQLQPRSDAYNSVIYLHIDTYLYLCIHVHITFVDDYAVGKHSITNDPRLDQIITMYSHIFKMPLFLLLRRTIAEAKQLTMKNKSDYTWSIFGADNYNNITFLQIDTYLCESIHITVVDKYIFDRAKLITHDALLDQILKMTTNSFFTMPLHVCLLLSKTNALHKQCN